MTISYQFSEELHHSCYKTAHPEGFPFDNEVLNDHFPGNHAHRPDSGTAEKVSQARTPVRCITWVLFAHFFFNSEAAGVETDGNRKPAISEQGKKMSGKTNTVGFIASDMIY